MHRARFEIECERAQLVKEAVEIDDKSEVRYTVSEDKLVVEVEAAEMKTLMKIVYSTGNRIQLSLDTVNKFGK